MLTFRLRGLAWLAAAALIGGCASAPATPTPPGGTSPTEPAGATPTPVGGSGAVVLGSRVDVSPAAALMTDVGQTRKLSATALDANGEPRPGAASWTSSHPDNVAIAADGTIAAVASGSSLITATVDGVASAPVLVYVTKPAAGVTLVSDEQVVGDVEAVDIETYRATLTGIAAKPGDRLLGTGGKPLAGEVTAVDGDSVTFELVPLPELVPELDIDEQIDLSAAALAVPAEIARLYDVTRAGTRFSFKPKANFDDLVKSSAVTPLLANRDEALAIVGGLFAQGGAVGTSALPPFGRCEVETTPSSDSVPVSVEGELAPSFDVEITPTVDLVYHPLIGLRRLVLNGGVKVTASMGVTVEVAFEGRIACSVDFGHLTIPIGALTPFLGPVVSLEAGFELAGKLTLQNAELGAEGTAQTALHAGVVCGDSCDFDAGMTDIDWQFEPKVDAPSFADVRLEPSFDLSAGVNLDIGPIARVNVAQGRIGAKLAADWAPQKVQILDAEYASSYGLTSEATIEPGEDLTEFGEHLSIDISGAGVKYEKELAQSPKGRLSLAQGAFTAGEQAVARVTLEPEQVEFLGLYNVDRILLVRHEPTANTLLASLAASDGQTDFDITFTAPAPMQSSALYAFVVTNFPALDLFGLEVSRQSSKIAFTRHGSGIFTINPDGSFETQVTNNGLDLGAAISPDGTKIAFHRGVGVMADIYVVNIDGSDLVQLTDDPAADNYPAWSPDGSQIAFTSTRETNSMGAVSAQVFVMDADGSNVRRVTTGVGASILAQQPSWSPDGTKIAFGGKGNTGNGICTVEAAGGAGTCVAFPSWPHIAIGLDPSWSPDGSLLAFKIIRHQLDAGGNAVPEWQGLAVIPLGGGSPAQLVENAESPAWSADGSRIVFVLNGDVHSVAADGSDIQQLTSTAAGEADPNWGR